MNRIFLLLICCSTTVLFSGSTNATPPNIVLIISDDQAWTDYGFMGHPTIRTPHLDRLASRSALFRRGYVPTALCRPSLATLATGLYAHRHGITGNDPARVRSGNQAEFNQLQEDLISKINRIPTLPGLLRQAGYRSHQSGKWWEGNFRRGGFTHGMTRGFPMPGGRHGDDGLKIGRQGLSPVLEFINDSVAQQTPFFVWYAPFLPHTPHNPPERLLVKYRAPDRPIELATYFAMCEWFDQTCGELVDHIQNQGLAENTLIVYVTDNGWIQRTAHTLVPDGWRTQFAPRSKQSPNEGGIRTPVMLCWPGTIEPADRSELVSSIDLVPTMLAAAGVNSSPSMPGISLLPLVTESQTLQRDVIFGESFAHDIVDLDNPQDTLLYRWIIQDRWKLILTYDGQVTRYRVVHDYAERRPQLFDLHDDPHEENNVAADHPQLVARLAERIANWWNVDERMVQTTP
ncbi:MAG: sulfatase [Fuerstiella sp.]|nr:sulfatase [Fuerstiella sp.]